MIQITPHIRIYLCISAVDFRKGIDGLAGICRNVLEQDPFCGSMYIFRNKRKTAIKILLYDGQGFWLFIKRLSRGRFRWWPTPGEVGVGIKSGGVLTLPLTAPELHLLIWNGDPALARITVAADWKKISLQHVAPPGTAGTAGAPDTSGTSGTSDT
jgi:transposase